MKKNNSNDPLDLKIDELLSSQPLKPSDGFAQRVLTATEEVAAQAELKRTFKMGKLLQFALPLAAVIAFALTLAQTLPEESLAPSPVKSAVKLSTADIQEILLLQEGLSNLVYDDDEPLRSTGLLDALDALYLEIES